MRKKYFYVEEVLSVQDFDKFMKQIRSVRRPELSSNDKEILLCRADFKCSSVKICFCIFLESAMACVNQTEAILVEIFFLEQIDPERF